MIDTIESVCVDSLRFDAAIVLADGAMSAADVAQARRSGKITMAANEKGTALLEAGGVILAEGRITKKRGKTAFVITKMLAGGKEIQP